MGEEKEGFRRYLGLTFLIGFGFFTMGLMDILYDTYVPLFLGTYVSSNALVGLIMTLDNVFAIFLIPIVSVWSDNTRTKIGRRMPFIIVALPLSALFFAFLPYSAAESLIALILIIFGLNIFKQSARGPVVALMPDTIPGEYRSEANGVINTMGALGAILGTLGLARLMDLSLNLPILGETKERLPFVVAGCLVIVATILVFAFVHERSRDAQGAEKKVPLIASIKAIASEKDKSALWILLSLFFWFLGYQGVLPFIGKFCVEVLDTSKSNAALPAGLVGVAQALCAIPAGYVAHKVGRRRSIRISLAAVAAVLLIGCALSSSMVSSIASSTRFAAFLGIMFVYGVFWIVIITNSFPMLWQMASFGTIGIYTGLYYTFSQSAAIAAPPLTGALIDLVGYPGIFAFAAACMVAAFFIMGKVTKGEPSENSASENSASEKPSVEEA
jgi:maltose/moltooligosaccharide transporter